MEPSAYEVIIFGVNVDDKVLSLLGSIAEDRHYTLRELPTALSFLEQFDRSVPGCVVADFAMPNGGGWELVEVLQAEPPETPILFLSDSMDVATAVELMKNGVVDVLVKPFHWESLSASIARAVEIDRRQKQAFASKKIALARYTLLTRREREVFELVVSGLPSKGIARVLDRSQKTVEVHRTSIMKKLEAKSVVDLVRLGIELKGLDQPGTEPDSRFPAWKNFMYPATAQKTASHESWSR